MLLIFDLDGTLIDSKLDLAHSVNAMLRHLGRGPIGHELIYSYVGNGAPVLVQKALGKETSDEECSAALDYFMSYYRDHKLDYTTPYPGVREALDVLGPKHQMAVLTNKPVRISREIVKDLGLGDYFFRVYGGNSFERKKPDPAGVQQLLQEAGVTAADTLLIGDSAVDVQTARNARVPCCGVTYGFQPESLLMVRPEYLIDDMRELVDIVKAFRNGRVSTLS